MYNKNNKKWEDNDLCKEMNNNRILLNALTNSWNIHQLIIE